MENYRHGITNLTVDEYFEFKQADPNFIYNSAIRRRLTKITISVNTFNTIINTPITGQLV